MCSITIKVLSSPARLVERPAGTARAGHRTIALHVNVDGTSLQPGGRWTGAPFLWIGYPDIAAICGAASAIALLTMESAHCPIERENRYGDITDDGRECAQDTGDL